LRFGSIIFRLIEGYEFLYDEVLTQGQADQPVVTTTDYDQIRAQVQSILSRHERSRSSLIPILHQVQDLFGHVPPAAIAPIAQWLGIGQAEVHGVLSFYSHFRLSPQGRHHITVCAGTACHVEGTPVLLRELRRLLGIEPGQRTTDGLFSLSQVGCLGCCALAPAMVIDGRVYSNVSPARLPAILTEHGFTRGVQSDEAA